MLSVSIVICFVYWNSFPGYSSVYVQIRCPHTLKMFSVVRRRTTQLEGWTLDKGWWIWCLLIPRLLCLRAHKRGLRFLSDPICVVLSGGLGSSVQAACRKTNESVYPAVDGVHWKKKLGSSHRYSKEKNKSPGNSRQLTDYFVTREGTEVLMQQLIEFSCYKYTHTICAHRYSLIPWWVHQLIDCM